jgi:hypothetical protein
MMKSFINIDPIVANEGCFLMPVVSDDDAFEVGFKLQDQYNNIRLGFNQGTS